MYSKSVVRQDKKRSKRVGNVGHDKRLFSGTADRTHPVNVQRVPMRGGIRL